MDRLTLKFWHKFLKRYIDTTGTGRTPRGGSQKRRRAHALIVPAFLDFRDMREVGGLIVRRESSHTKGSARLRLAPSPEVKTYRALLNIRDIRAGAV